MLYDKYSKNDGTTDFDNKYFESDFSFTDYLNNQANKPKPNTSNSLNPRNYELDRFIDASAPPGESQNTVIDPTILTSSSNNTILPSNADYDDITDTTDSKLYDNYDKYGRSTRIEPYRSPNSILGKKTRFTNFSDGLTDWMLLSWTDIIIILNLVISLLLMYKYYHLFRKYKKMKYIMKYNSMPLFKLNTNEK
jgi:hypothetical protein